MSSESVGRDLSSFSAPLMSLESKAFFNWSNELSFGFCFKSELFPVKFA